MSDKVSPEISVPEKIKAVVKKLEQVVQPTGFIRKETGELESVEARSQEEILVRAEKNEALLPEDVLVFIALSKDEITQLQKLPETVKFSVESGDGGRDKRREQLQEILGKIGIKKIQVKGEKFTADEIWDAVVDVDGRSLPKDDRGQKILRNIDAIREAIEDEQRINILYLAAGLEYEKVDPLSLTTQQLRQPHKDASFQLHKKQKVPNQAEAVVRDVLVIKKRLQRGQVVNTFLNQRAEGRTGQKEAPKPGDSQLPGMISYKEGKKTLIIQGLSEDESNRVVAVLEEVDVFKEKHKEELLGGFQGRKGWIAEATLRRMHEIWKETSDDFQKNVGDLMTWTSELGHGCLVSEWLSIPGVAEVLTWSEWYQQREPVTDKPLPIKPIEEIEAEVKQRARNLDIPTSKVDLALFLSEILQLGYWTGRVGWKTRHPGEKYGYLDIGGGLPVWSWENFVDKSDLTKEQKAVFTPEKRKVFEFQLAELNAFVVGMAMTSYTTEHLGRIPDEASQEDLLFLTEVGEPPIYAMPDDAIIEVIADLDMIPFEKMKQNFQYSFLHREQYRWQFVYAYYYKDKDGKRLFPQFASPIGEEAVEKQYFNPWSVIIEGNDEKSIKLRENADKEARQRRKELIDFLQKPESSAAVTLQEAGLDPNLITDEVIIDLFTDGCMRTVNQIRTELGRKVNSEDLKQLVAQINPDPGEERNHQLATVLEFVLRDKRTWGLDMGQNNSFINDPQLSREIRERGGFSADQIGLMVTAEYNRKYHTETLSKFLGVMARAHLRNEFYSGKQIVEELSMMYGDIARTRANSLVNPWTILETSASIRATMMLIGYWDAGYAHTGGRMVADQETLYDQADIDRLFHERFYPVIGAAQRVRMGHEGYIKEMKDTCIRQRARLSASYARFLERQFFQQGASLEAIMGFLAGEGGKHIYTHCVPVFRNGREELVLDTDTDFFEAQEERKAEMFYWPGSDAKLERWNSEAKQGQLDEDHARQQIDNFVQLGFMRRWKNDRQEKVGLGDLFKVEFKVNGKQHIYPIEFYINLRQNLESVARAFAVSRGFKLVDNGQEIPENISARYFWTLAKTDQLKGDDKKIWEDFCKMMIKGWLVDPSMPDSTIPQFFWEWYETTQAALKIPEKGIRGKGGKIILAARGIKDVVIGEGLKWLHKEGSIWQKTLAELGVRADLVKRWQANPIPGALKEIKENFCDKIVTDFIKQLKNSAEDGKFLREKVDLRQQIKNAFLADKIDEKTYKELMNLVINTPYRQTLAKNFTNPDFYIHKKWPTIYGFAVEKLAEFVEKLGEGDIKNNFNAQWVFSVMNATPAGYVIGATVAIIGGGAFVIATSPAWFPATLGVLGGMQVFSMIGSWVIKGIDWGVRKANKGKKGLWGSRADSLVFEAEYAGGK